MAYLRRLRSHQLCFEGLSVMLGAPWVTSDRNEVSQREEVEAWMLTGTQLQGWITCSRVRLKSIAPLGWCRQQSGKKPWIKFLISRSAKRIRVIDDDNLKHLFKYLFGLPPARQQAKRLQLITHTLGFWASKYICVSLGFASLYPTYVHIIYGESPHTKKPLHCCNGFYNFDKFPNYNGTYYPLKFKN